MNILSNILPYVSALIGMAIVDLWIIFFGSIIFPRFPHTTDLPSMVLSRTPTYIISLGVLLLLFFNINQIAPAREPFLLLVIATPVMMICVTRKVPAELRSAAWVDFRYLLMTQTVTLISIVYFFRVPEFWLYEGPNHDSLIYYEGLIWALDHPLQVASYTVRGEWGLNTCGLGGGMWIGRDCLLYRGGTYTLSAWTQFFSPEPTGSGTYATAVYASTFIWLSFRLAVTAAALKERARLARPAVTTALAILAGLSTAWISAVLNFNLATALAGGALAVSFSICILNSRSVILKSSLHGIWIGVATHLYAEALFYAVALVGLAYAIEAAGCIYPSSARPRMRQIIRSALLTCCVALLAANFVAFQAFSSLTFFAQIAQGGDFPAWYLRQDVWVWLGAPFAGVLVGSAPTNLTSVLLGAFILLVTLLVLGTRRSTYVPLASLSIVTILCITSITIRRYSYGEHKIIQILGPSWHMAAILAFTAMTASTVRHSLGFRPRVVLALLGFVATIIVIADFGTRGAALLRRFDARHGIRSNLTEVVSFFRPGDVILLDDNAWVGVEKFQKSHYLIFLSHVSGATVVLPEIDTDPLRGGYYRAHRGNSLRNSRPRWLVSGKGGLGLRSVFTPPGTPVYDGEDYLVYPLTERAVAVAGNGWYDCELDHCWTANPFTIEVVGAENSSPGTLEIDIQYFYPPKGAEITVQVNGKPVKGLSANMHRIRVPLDEQYSYVTVSGNWTPISPRDLGENDDRKLLGMIRSVSVLRDSPPPRP